MDRIKDGYEKDAFFQKLSNYLATFKQDGPYWTKDGRIVVPDTDTLRQDILTEMHAPAYSGHVGTIRTAQALMRTFYSKGLHADVDTFVTSCHECQRNKASNRKPAGLLRSLEIPDRNWECVSMDLITHLPVSTSGKDAIVVFVDKLSKMVRLAATTTTVNAEVHRQCVSFPWLPTEDCIGSRCSVHRTFPHGSNETAEDSAGFLYIVPPSNGWTNGTNEPDTGRYVAALCQSISERLG